MPLGGIVELYRADSTAARRRDSTQEEEEEEKEEEWNVVSALCRGVAQPLSLRPQLNLLRSSFERRARLAFITLCASRIIRRWMRDAHPLGPT